MAKGSSVQYWLREGPGKESEAVEAVFSNNDGSFTYKARFPKNSFYIIKKPFVDRMLSNNGLKYVGGNIVRENIHGKELVKSMNFINELTDAMLEANPSDDVATVFSKTYSEIKKLVLSDTSYDIPHILQRRGFEITRSCKSTP